MSDDLNNKELEGRIPGLDCQDFTFEQVSRIIAWHKNVLDNVREYNKALITKETHKARKEEAEYIFHLMDTGSAHLAENRIEQLEREEQ